MKWMRFRLGDREAFGRVDGDDLVVHKGDLFGAPEPTGERVPLATVAPLPPVRPGKLIGLWNNFHVAAEKNGWARPAEPLWFLKAGSSLAGPGEPIRPPAGYDGRVTYEGELAIVIGRRATAVTPDAAAACIFGYTCANDVTALDLLGRDPSFPQWARAKSFDTFGVIGPVIDTAFDPAVASVRTRLNGRERQNYPLSDMIFPPAELVSRLSCDMTLQPGDVILCGTSLGVLPMKPGAEVTVEIDGIGALTNVFGAS